MGIGRRALSSAHALACGGCSGCLCNVVKVNTPQREDNRRVEVASGAQLVESGHHMLARFDALARGVAKRSHTAEIWTRAVGCHDVMERGRDECDTVSLMLKEHRMECGLRQTLAHASELSVDCIELHWRQRVEVDGDVPRGPRRTASLRDKPAAEPTVRSRCPCTSTRRVVHRRRRRRWPRH